MRSGLSVDADLTEPNFICVGFFTFLFVVKHVREASFCQWVSALETRRGHQRELVWQKEASRTCFTKKGKVKKTDANEVGFRRSASTDSPLTDDPLHR